MKAKKILFANVPADGHFNPLTSLALYLKSMGHEVRWYTGLGYKEKIEKMGIPYYPLQKAMDLSAGGFDPLLPERDKQKTAIAKLKFDLKHVFILRSTEYFADIKEIKKEFDFEVMIADVCFTAIPFVRQKLGVPVLSIGVIPLSEESRDLAPNGLGLTPLASFAGRRKQDLMRFFTNRFIFGSSIKLVNQIFKEYGMKPVKGNVFDTLVKESTLLLQTGTPGFEYKRRDLSKNIRFIGALLPLQKPQAETLRFIEKLKQYRKIILVTQGTVEKDNSKIIIPTLEAFKGTDTLVIATTGGSKTDELRAAYQYPNLVIEDFVPFKQIMPYADVYVSNGGYGGVMLAIEHELPMVVAGVHEGKNEITARVGYFKLGINLNTETPTPEQILKAVNSVMLDDVYSQNLAKLRTEFLRYNAYELVEKYIAEVTAGKKAVKNTKTLKQTFVEVA